MPNFKDKSPDIPLLGNLKESSLFLRRQPKTDIQVEEDTYKKFDQYDNVSLNDKNSMPVYARVRKANWYVTHLMKNN